MRPRISLTAFYSAGLLLTLVTLCPIEYRPTTGHVTMERLAAFAVFGALCGFAFPRKQSRNLAVVIAVAVVLEFGQRFAPTRHGELLDALVKIVGGVTGVLVAGVLTERAPRARSRRPGRRGPTSGKSDPGRIYTAAMVEAPDEGGV
jgi:glycopeptide antibiotics resistance protein